MSLKEIKNQVLQAEIEFSRVVGSINLIAVSKVQPNERIEAVLEQGHRIFGENRIQEAQSKWPDFKEQFEGIELHIIGPLQTNKTRVAMGLRPVQTEPPAPLLTQTKSIVGTPAYMAPEQQVGGEAIESSDQYAFCVALYELLYGVRPFPEVDEVELDFKEEVVDYGGRRDSD